MQAVILAGGYGSRLSEETHLRPKPMIEVGGRPILWHVMKGFSKHGITDFIICLGYKGYIVKEYFANFALHSANVTFDFRTGTTELHGTKPEPWRVTLVETGADTQTGGRLKRVLPYLIDNRPFFFTYGDGVSDIDLTALVAHHHSHGRLATVTGVQPQGRFGALQVEADDEVSNFQEKPPGDGAWINGGFFVLSPEIGRRIESDSSIWEQEPVNGLARDGELKMFRHDGFWKSMDTLRDQRELEALWQSGAAPWKTWE